MFLSNQDVLARKRKGEIKIKPFVKAHLGPAAYDLRLHRNFRVFRSDETTHIDVKEPFDMTEIVTVKRGGGFVIHPGEFVLASTVEEIGLPNDLVGLLEGRSSLGRIGIIVHATAAMVGPGFAGFLTFEMSNISGLPVKLYAGMRVAQLAFVKLSSPAELTYGSREMKSKYQGQKPPTQSRIWRDFGKK